MNEYLQDLIFYTYFFALIFIPIIVALLPYIKEVVRQRHKKQQREKALLMVKMYIEPYDDIWKNQVLSNNLLKAELRYLIIYLEGNGLKCKIKCNKKENTDKLWDLVLNKFSSSITYDEMLPLLIEYARISDISYDFSEKEVKLYVKLDEKIDVNNCSEIELTKLKGVNIAIAKRIASKREEIKGFKTKEEFFEFLNFKPHQEKQIRDYVKIRRIKVIKQMRKRFERRVDL